MMGRAPPMSGLAVAVVALLTLMASGDDQFDKDKKECAPQLVGMSPCISYVGGSAKVPTMDCCTALKQVLAASEKCLCLLIKYRNEPGLGVKIDANLALGLPAVCHTPSNISNCPVLLHLSPNSPDAKVFTDYVSRNSNTTSSTASNATVTPASSSTSSSKNSNNGSQTLRFGRLPFFYGLVAIFSFLLFCPI